MGLFRLALAWSVLLGHSGGHGLFLFAFIDRQVAVECFFIISGFYMALILNEKYLGPGRVWTFFQQRFLRLYPTYIILLVAILIGDGLITHISGQPYQSMKAWYQAADVLTPWSVALFVGSNLVVFGQDMVSLLQLDHITGALTFFNPAKNPTTFGHFFILNMPSWSLGVEAAFYLVAPLLVCRSIGVQAVFLVASVVLRFVIGRSLGGLSDEWTYTFFPPNLCFFLCGSLGYVVYKNYRGWMEAKLSLTSWKWGLGIFGLFVATYNRLPGAHQLYLVLLPLVCFMVPLLFTATRNNRLDRLIGELSYPFYLIHEHVLFYMKSVFSHFSKYVQSHFFAPTCVVITMLAAYLFYRFIELRVERFREGLYRKAQSRGEVTSRAPVSTAPNPQAAE